MSNDISVSLYNINKSVVSQLNETISTEAFCKRIATMYENTKNNYYFLYSKEISYFTLFSFKEDKDNNDGSFGEIILSCFPSIFGKTWSMVSAELVSENQAIEIWVKDSKQEAFVFYLFPYDNGVIPVGGSV